MSKETYYKFNLDRNGLIEELTALKVVAPHTLVQTVDENKVSTTFAVGKKGYRVNWSGFDAGRVYSITEVKPPKKRTGAFVSAHKVSEKKAREVLRCECMVADSDIDKLMAAADEKKGTLELTRFRTYGNIYYIRNLCPTAGFNNYDIGTLTAYEDACVPHQFRFDLMYSGSLTAHLKHPPRGVLEMVLKGIDPVGKDRRELFLCKQNGRTYARYYFIDRSFVEEGEELVCWYPIAGPGRRVDVPEDMKFEEDMRIWLVDERNGKKLAEEIISETDGAGKFGTAKPVFQSIYTCLQNTADSIERPEGTVTRKAVSDMIAAVAECMDVAKDPDDRGWLPFWTKDGDATVVGSMTMRGTKVYLLKKEKLHEASGIKWIEHSLCFDKEGKCPGTILFCDVLKKPAVFAVDVLLDATDYIGNSPELFNAENRDLDAMRTNPEFRKLVAETVAEEDDELAGNTQAQNAEYVWAIYKSWRPDEEEEEA